MAAQQKRIMMWATPRTLSTAFCRAMVSRGTCKILNEPAIRTFMFGVDRQIVFEFDGPHRPEGWPADDLLPLPGCSWADYRDQIGAYYDGYTEVFVKELAFRFKSFVDKGTLDDVIPRDCVHVFIVRDPEKTVRSWFHIMAEFPVDLLKHAQRGCYKHHPAANEMHEMSWSEMQRIYEWVVETKGYRPLVIDADDLQRDPESTLRRFCEFVQIDFQDSMVHWPPLAEDQKPQFDFFGDFFRAAKTEKQFLPPTTSERDVTKYSVVPKYAAILQPTIDRAKVVYEYLRAKTPDKTYCSKA